MTIRLDVGLAYAALATADLTGKMCYLAKIDSAGGIVITAANSDKVAGVITEEATAAKPASLQFGGIVPVILGATVVAGAGAMSDTNGKAITHTTPGTNPCFGIFLQGGAANEIVPVLMQGGI